MTRTSSTSASASWLFIGFAAGCATIVVVQKLLTCIPSEQKKDPFRSLTANSNNTSSNAAPRRRNIPPDIRKEQISRHTLYFGAAGMQKLKGSRVCVVGVGGVGSHSAHMLARSGLGALELIDFDQVTVSSLNRHACAVLADVGRPKVTVLQEYLQSICPDERYLRVGARTTMFTAKTAEDLLGMDQHWDMVVDCIDDIPTKTALIAYCVTHGIPIISCMSAGGKADPTRLLLTDLRAAAKDPLATKLRLSLQKYPSLLGDESYLDDMDRLTIIYSYEKTVVQLADFTDQQKAEGVHNYGAVDGMRIRIVPVQGTMPAIMGQAMAAYCLNRLSGVERFQPATVETLAKSTRHKLYQRLRNQEQRIRDRILALPSVVSRQPWAESKEPEHNCEFVTTTVDPPGAGETKTYWVGGLQIDIYNDLEYLGEIWRNRCAITGARLGTVLQLARWRWDRPSSCDNLVLLSADILPHFANQDPELYKQTMDPKLRAMIDMRLSYSRVDR